MLKEFEFGIMHAMLFRQSKGAMRRLECEKSKVHIEDSHCEMENKLVLKYIKINLFCIFNI